MANEFTYFTQLIMYLMVLYLLVLAAFLCIRRNEIKSRVESEPIEHRIMAEDERLTFTYTTSIKDIYECFWGRAGRPFLFASRVISVFFIFLSSIIVPVTQDASAFYYFDGWSIILSFIYFSCTVILTVMTMYTYRKRRRLIQALRQEIEWSYYPRSLAVATHLMFEMSGASIVASIYLNMNAFQTKSTVLELQTLLVLALLIVELACNNLRVRFDQLPASVAWVLFYLMVIWPAVFTGSMKDWPYTAMSASTQKCFSNYTLIFVGIAVSYTMWYALYKLKKLIVHFYLVAREGPQAAAAMEMEELHSVQDTVREGAAPVYDPQTGAYTDEFEPQPGQYWDPVTGEYYYPDAGAAYSQYGYSQYDYSQYGESQYMDDGSAYYGQPPPPGYPDPYGGGGGMSADGYGFPAMMDPSAYPPPPPYPTEGDATGMNSAANLPPDVSPPPYPGPYFAGGGGEGGYDPNYDASAAQAGYGGGYDPNYGGYPYPYGGYGYGYGYGPAMDQVPLPGAGHDMGEGPVPVPGQEGQGGGGGYDAYYGQYYPQPPPGYAVNYGMPPPGSYPAMESLPGQQHYGGGGGGGGGATDSSVSTGREDDSFFDAESSQAYSRQGPAMPTRGGGQSRPTPLQVHSPTGEMTNNPMAAGTTGLAMRRTPASHNNSSPATNNPITRRRQQQPPAPLMRTPTAMFGGQDEDVNAFAFGFTDF